MPDDFAPEFDFAIDHFIEHQESLANRPLKFTLTASSIGRKSPFKATVRRLTMVDRASLGDMPEDAANFVWKRLQKLKGEMDELTDAGATPKDITEQFAQNDKHIQAANLFCVAGFVDPTLVLEPEREDIARRRFHVSRIQVEDRLAFMLACQDADSAFARRFELFRDAPAGDVPADPQGAVLEHDTVGVSELS